MTRMKGKQMIRKFWFAPDVCSALTNHDETMSVCMNSVTQYMQDEASRHGNVSLDLDRFDAAVIKVTAAAIESINPHLRNVLWIAVNRQLDSDLGDVEVRMTHTYYSLITNNPGANQIH